MSFPQDCRGCARGNHADHVHPRLVGGSQCGCKGDCADRFPAFCGRITAPLTPAAEPTKERSE